MQKETHFSFKNPLTSSAKPFTAGIYEPVPLAAKPLSEQKNTHVDEYPAPREQALTYPGVRPETSFTNGDGAEVWPVAVHEDPESGEIRFYINTESGVWDLNDALKLAGASLMEDRIPVVTFGSNANPGQLLNKFRELQDETDRQIVPTTKAMLHDVAPVYVPKVGIWNYSFADLYPEKGAETEVFVNWLSPAQLEKMHKTEKAYIFSQYSTIELGGTDLKLPAYLYAGNASAYLGEDGRPVRLSTVNTTGSKLRALSQREIQEELLKDTKDHLIDRFEHIKTVINEGDFSVGALHEVIQTMPEIIGLDGTPLKKNMIGNAMAEYLASIERTAPTLLSAIPVENQNIKPLTLGELMALPKQ